MRYNAYQLLKACPNNMGANANTWSGKNCPGRNSAGSGGNPDGVRLRKSQWCRITCVPEIGLGKGGAGGQGRV